MVLNEFIAKYHNENMGAHSQQSGRESENTKFTTEWFFKENDTKS